MGIFKRNSESIPIAYPVNFTGPAPYMKAFEGSGFGVVFEDDGETGYLYATNEHLDEILDALHLYNAGDPGQVRPGDEIFIVWNPALQKAGIFYHHRFQAVIDFKGRRACCRTGFPSRVHKGWCRSSHKWDETLVQGLEP